MHIRSIIENYLSENASDKFAEWAWGESYKFIDLCSKESVKLWNERHGHLLLINSSNNPKNDIPNMISLWKKSES